MNSGAARELRFAMAALDEELAGTPYRAVALIGRGGMGTVFEVEHLVLRRRLVLKVLRSPDRRDLEDRLRFEAQTLGQLSHPHLLAVFDFGFTRSARPFLVTELLRGQTLKALVAKRGALSVGEAAHHTIQALSGLANAHRAGVVHRDVKTDNLFVCECRRDPLGFVKVIDFGVAKLGEGADGLRASIHPLEVPTGDGMMVGTPSFMSPEQICAKPVDRRADIFSMGMVLYRLLAGRGPFEHDDLLAIVRANVRDAAPPPSSFSSSPIPAALDAVVLRAIAKRRRDRFQSAEEMAAALAPFAVDVVTRDTRRASSLPRERRRDVDVVEISDATTIVASRAHRPSPRALSRPWAPDEVPRSSRRGGMVFLLMLCFIGCSTWLLLTWFGWA